jgi:hypothetical protein
LPFVQSESFARSESIAAYPTPAYMESPSEYQSTHTAQTPSVTLEQKLILCDPMILGAAKQKIRSNPSIRLDQDKHFVKLCLFKLLYPNAPIKNIAQKNENALKQEIARRLQDSRWSEIVKNEISTMLLQLYPRKGKIEMERMIRVTYYAITGQNVTPRTVVPVRKIGNGGTKAAGTQGNFAKKRVGDRPVRKVRPPRVGSGQ